MPHRDFAKSQILSFEQIRFVQSDMNLTGSMAHHYRIRYGLLQEE